MQKRLAVLLCVFIVSQMAVAQWHYSVSVTTNGCGYLDKSVAESQVKYWMGEGYKTFSSKYECERSRMFVMSQSYTDGSCRVSYIASPCTGPVGSSGNASIFNSNNGSSFYSTNPANEIRDWSNDDMERMLALNPKFNFQELKTVATGDIAFDNLIENMSYSDEAFSNRMPSRSSYVEADDNIVAIGRPVRGSGILVPDDFTDRPFTGLGGWSSDDLKPLNIDLKPVPNGIKTFDEEGWDLWRDGLRLGKDMGMFVYGLGEGVTASSVAVASFLGGANINLWTELYKAKSKIDLDEAYEAPNNILTEAAVFWGGKEYAIVGNVLYNAINSTVGDFVNLVSDVTTEKVKEEVTNKVLTKEGAMILSKAENYANIGTIALEGFDFGGKVTDYYNKRK